MLGLVCKESNDDGDSVCRIKLPDVDEVAPNKKPKLDTDKKIKEVV